MQPAKPRAVAGADWARTPVAVRQYVAGLECRVAVLEQQRARLTRALNRTSANPSRPPSADPPRPYRRSPRRPSGRRPGGQPDHPGHWRAPVPAARVSVRVTRRPARCDHCRAPLHGRDPTPQRHQVVEVPPARAVVTAYALHALRCARCGRRTRAGLPRGGDAQSR